MCSQQDFYILQSGKIFVVDGNQSHFLQSLTLLPVVYNIPQAIQRCALCQFFFCFEMAVVTPKQNPESLSISM